MLAAGSRPNFYDTPGADDPRLPAVRLADGERLRSRIFEVFEDADRDPSVVAKGALNLVVVGGGPTGVETAGALADLVGQVMPSRYHDLDVRAAKVILVDPGSVVLSAFSSCGQAYAARRLTDKGVDLQLGVKVSDIAEDRVTLSDGRQIMTRTVVWAGGIQPSDVIAHAGITVGHGGRIDVLPDLTVAGLDGIYVIGDAGNTPGADGKALPQLGSVAVQAGRRAADNILADIVGRPRGAFRYRDKGIMAMIGRNAAVVEIGKRRRELHGVVAFGTWLGRARVVAERLPRATAVWAWGWDYFTRDRAPSIIAPDASRIDWDEPATAPVDGAGPPATMAAHRNGGCRGGQVVGSRQRCCRHRRPQWPASGRPGAPSRRHRRRAAAPGVRGVVEQRRWPTIVELGVDRQELRSTRSPGADGKAPSKVILSDSQAAALNAAGADAARHDRRLGAADGCR